MATIWDVDDWVDDMSVLPVMSFYPTAVAKDTGLPLQAVFERLIHLTQDGKLQLQWEIRCPNYECLRNIEVVEDPSLFIGKIIYCKTCGEELEITPDIVFPLFKINPDYRERARQKKNESRNRSICNVKSVAAASPLPIGSPDLVTPQIVEQIKPLLGTSSVIIINKLEVATNCGTIIKDSVINHYLESLESETPEIAGQIQDGLKYKELEKSLQELAKEFSELKKSSEPEKPGKFQKIKDIFDSIKNVSDTVNELKPYAQNLYNLAKPFVESHTGISLPDWQ